MVLVAKKVEKMIKIFQIFFFRKIEYKSSSETKFHQKRPHRTDFRLKTARHEKITSSENGPNSSSNHVTSTFFLPTRNLFSFRLEQKSVPANIHTVHQMWDFAVGNVFLKIYFKWFTVRSPNVISTNEYCYIP